MHTLHAWDVTAKEAVEIQNRLRCRVRLEDNLGPITTVAGVDVRIARGSKQGTCAIVVLSFNGLAVVDEQVACAAVTFPYVPGLLAFREVPIFLAAYRRLRVKPDLIFFDGHGFAHPRRFGLACHAGVVIDKPTIGCAKSKLVGDYVEP